MCREIEGEGEGGCLIERERDIYREGEICIEK